MDNKIEKILEKLKDKRIGIFIDDANLFYIQKRIGWKIDWLKFKKFLDGYIKESVYTYYIGMPPMGQARLENERIKKELKDISFVVRTKPLKKIYLDDKKIDFKNKCNCDVEIAFDIARNIEKFDSIIIVSGDSDFLEAKNFCIERSKGFLIMCFEERVAWEIRRVYHLFFEDIKEIIKK
jgi:uncharacterized LabA/DUF88 family protein